VAELQADTVVALLAPGAVGVKGTDRHAVASVANLASWTNITCSTKFRDPNAAFSGSWYSCKARWALAGLSLVLGSADRVGTTRASH
jgi:hypothetical protein